MKRGESREQALLVHQIPGHEDAAEADVRGRRALKAQGALDVGAGQPALRDEPLTEPGRVHSTGAPGSYCRSRRSLPGLKRIVLPGGIVTSTPVFGLRPMPGLRRLTWN